jgi:hypothetical protein
LLCGCGPRSPEQLSKFSTAVKNVSTIYGSAIDLDSDIDGKYKAQRVAIKYATGADWNFPPPPATFLKGITETKDRTTLVGALGDYADALASLNDAALSKDFASAASSLSLALTDYINARATAAVPPGNADATALVALQNQQLQATGALVVEFAGITIRALQDAETRQMITRMQPVIEQIVQLLSQDSDALAQSTSIKAFRFQRDATVRLVALRDDPKLSTLQKYDLYMSINNEVSALKARADILKDLSKALKKLPDAHKALLEPDADVAVAAFVADANEITAKVKALNEVEAKIRDAVKKVQG